MLSGWLRHHLHQTPLSRSLRRIPGVSTLAGRWWLISQSSALSAALSSLGRPVWEATGSLPELDLPALAQVAERDPKTVDLGDAFSAEMGSWCNTSKFQTLGYQDVYARVVAHLRSVSPRVLEVGIGVNDPTSPSGMEATHRPGASLIGWFHYFPGSEVHGADIDRRVLIDTDEYTTHWVDQRDEQSLRNLASTIGAPIDLIVDDGLHTPEANGLTIMALLPYLAPHGVFVVEDILPEYDALWLRADSWLPPDYGMAFYPGNMLRGERDEGLAVIWRRA